MAHTHFCAIFSDLVLQRIVFFHTFAFAFSPINTFYMSPEEMKGIIALEMKRHRITHEQAAAVVKMKSRQSFSNLLYNKRYFSPAHAQLLCDAYGYNFDFLTQGIGPVYANGSTEGGDATTKPSKKYYVSRFQYNTILDCLDFIEERTDNNSIKTLISKAKDIANAVEGEEVVDFNDIGIMIVDYENIKELIWNDLKGK